PALGSRRSTLDPIIATGFHRNTMLNEEGGIDPLEFRFYAMVDRVATTGTTWLGLTVGCAQCHTHKFDPILHTDFYAMMAFLNNADEPDLDLPDAALAPAKSGQRAIVPGKADASELIRRITSPDHNKLMPPPETKKHLTPTEMDTLRRWVASGADYQPHWAFIRPKDHAIGHGDKIDGAERVGNA
ncbi:MAG: DUF1549 domain-containing protein, partial [Verrucomicrobia bacterium]|nr:DUF1549 domain-containing protein [Verrucomicrobiota bacterium]